MEKHKRIPASLTMKDKQNGNLAKGTGNECANIKGDGGVAERAAG